ncbi:MAG: deaminase [Candidatus Nanoarchaeia archaeon]
MDIQALLRQAYKIARDNSDDPNTQNAALLLREGKVVLAGWNYFVGEMTAEKLERPEKYDHFSHAETDVLFRAARFGIPTDGATIICPWYACSPCAIGLGTAGIEKIIGHQASYDCSKPSWQRAIDKGLKKLDFYGVKHEWWDGEVGGVEIKFNDKLWAP